MIGQEMRVAITSAWLIVSAVLLFMLIAPHLLSETALLSASTAFRLLHHHQGMCFLCGMTRAFIAISRGRLTEAVALNDWSVTLYGIIVSNELAAALFLFRRIRKWFLSKNEAGKVTIKQQHIRR
ncbi:MAG: DUF2752 domain-containing protein [Nitrospira sp.]|nr:DUF2752 domain-containing protein [Nitrospira sp.]